MENDLKRSLITGEVEISGSLHLNTKDNMDLYPLIQGTDNFFFSCRYNKKSATLARVGRDTEWPNW